MILSHKIALCPTIKQEQMFRRASGVARFAWNWGLAEWKRCYKAGGKPTAAKLKKRFNSIKKEQFPWIYESPKDANQQPFANLGVAFSRFFAKKSGYPNFKKRGINDSFYISNDKFRFSGKMVHLPKIGWVKIRESLRFAGKIMSATVSRTAGRWFISVQVDVGEFTRARTSDCIVGIDIGIKHAAVLSDGSVFDAPKPLKAALRALAMASKSLARKVRGSSRRNKARLRLAKIHAKVARIRLDFIHKLTSKICRENQTVVIEDLNVSGMIRNRCLSRAISDIGFYEFRRQLTYKSVIYGVNLIVADRWFPSSKTCSSCGSKKKKLKLSERDYSCSACGVVLDRDLNAALNLRHLADGLSVSARGAGATTAERIPAASSGCEARTKA